jgi:hypothetical protein
MARFTSGTERDNASAISLVFISILPRARIALNVCVDGILYALASVHKAVSTRRIIYLNLSLSRGLSGQKTAHYLVVEGLYSTRVNGTMI